MKYNIGDRIRFKNSKNSNEIYKVLEYNEEEGYKTRLEQVGATVIIPNWQIEYTELVNEQVSEQVSKSEDSSVNSSVKKLKLIDILNKIANGELKEGTKVKYKLSVDSYVVLIFNGDLLKYEKNNKTFFFDYADTQAECELIEPTDNTKIEELNVKGLCEIFEGKHTVNPNLAFSTALNKLNEVIRYINKED